MAWQLMQTSAYGTSTPAVARTIIQGKDILDCFAVTQEKKVAALHILFEIHKKLLRCVPIQEELAAAAAAAREGIKTGKLSFESNARVYRPPSVPDLETKAESFLQGAKLVIATTTKLIEPFYGRDFGHKLHKLRAWAVSEFGETHKLVQFANEWEPWISEVLDMRNAVDHPSSGYRKKLHVANFQVQDADGQVTLHAPRWWLEGEPPMYMSEGMTHALETLIRFQEDLLAILFHLQTAEKFPFLQLMEISEDKRDPKCPIRLSVQAPTIFAK